MNNNTICCKLRNGITDILERMTGSVSVNSCESEYQRKMNTVNITSSIKTNERFETEENYEGTTMIIPAGTHLCPNNRHFIPDEKHERSGIMQDDFYIILNQSVEIRLEHAISVIIDGVKFNVINSDSMKRYHDMPTGDLRNSQSFVIPEGTSYHVSDASKDAIGLSHFLKMDEKFRVKPGSYVYLTEGAELILNDKVNVILKNRTLCML
jgi:hypothetical protein